MVARCEPFFALATRLVKALGVDVVDAKMEVYALMSADDGGGSYRRMSS